MAQPAITSVSLMIGLSAPSLQLSVDRQPSTGKSREATLQQRSARWMQFKDGCSARWMQAKVVPSNGQQQRRHHGVLDEAARELILERDLLPVDAGRHNHPAVLRVDLPDLLPLGGLGVSWSQDPMLSLLISPLRQHAS